MPGIDLISSSAVRRPPVRLEMVPPVATSRTRGTTAVAAVCGCGDVATACARQSRGVRTTTESATTAAQPVRAAGLLPARRAKFGMKRIQVPVEEGPHAVPGIALLARVLRLPGLRIDAAIEGVTTRRVVVNHGFGERR